MKAMRYPDGVFTDRSSRQWPQPEQSGHKGDVLQRPGPQGDHHRQSAGHHDASDRFEYSSRSYAERGGKWWWNGEESGRCNSTTQTILDRSCTFGYCLCRRRNWNVTDWNVSRLHYALDDERRWKAMPSTIETLTPTSPGSVEVTLPTATTGDGQFQRLACRGLTTSCNGTARFLPDRLLRLQRYQFSASVSHRIRTGRQIRDQCVSSPTSCG